VIIHRFGIEGAGFLGSNDTASLHCCTFKAESLSGLFLVGYGLQRFVVEFARQPDAHLNYVAFNWMTQGQLLSLPMIALGAYFLLRKTSIKG